MPVESLGGIYYFSPSSYNTPLTLAKRAAIEVSAVDHTRCGRATASSRSLMQHHCQRLSSAAVMWDAAAICKKIKALKQQACLLPSVSPSLVPTVA
jgi:hypothetical protein